MDHFDRCHRVASAHPTNKAVLAMFWRYVLIQLAWGVVNTLMTAMKLFR
ncbi:MFS transporter small subunit [Burkholderia sp. B21-007]|nr:oxalate:formate antiporter [Burkholderia sp. B21-007]UEP33174.1 oxalate:formate antiporter [Burkholderia sp. B21-007]